MQNFPFSRGAPGGLDYTLGQRLEAEAINTIDKNAAQAADGSVWTDLAVVRNFSKSTRVTGSGQAIFWDASLKAWVNAYTSTVDTPAVDISVDGGDDWVPLTSPAAGSNWNVTWSGASRGDGTILLGGGGGSATAAKIRETSNSGTTWTNRNITASGTERVSCLAWSDDAQLFVAGLSSSASTNIETSYDGIIWIQRTGLGNSDARGSVAFGNGVALMLSSSSVPRALRSANGAVTWTSVAMPSSANWGKIAFSARAGFFMAVGNGVIATTADGTIWTTSGLTAPFSTGVGGLCSFGRLWVAAGVNGSQSSIAVSADNGVTWTRVKLVTGTPCALGTDTHQVMVMVPNAAFASLRSG